MITLSPKYGWNWPNTAVDKWIFTIQKRGLGWNKNERFIPKLQMNGGRCFFLFLNCFDSPWTWFWPPCLSIFKNVSIPPLIKLESMFVFESLNMIIKWTAPSARDANITNNIWRQSRCFIVLQAPIIISETSKHSQYFLMSLWTHLTMRSVTDLFLCPF